MGRIVVSSESGVYIHVHDDCCCTSDSEEVSRILSQISTLIANAAPAPGYPPGTLETVG